MFFPMRNRNLNQLLLLLFKFCIVDGCEGCHKPCVMGWYFVLGISITVLILFFVAEFASKCKHWNTFFLIIELIALCWCQVLISDLSVIYFFIITFCWVTVCETSYFMLIITKHYFALQIDKKNGNFFCFHMFQRNVNCTVLFTCGCFPFLLRSWAICFYNRLQ